MVDGWLDDEWMMGGWVCRWMDGWMNDGWMVSGGWMGGWVDGWVCGHVSGCGGRSVDG